MSDDLKPDDPGKWSDACISYIGVAGAIVDDVFPSYFDQHRMHKGDIQDDARSKLVDRILQQLHSPQRAVGVILTATPEEYAKAWALAVMQGETMDCDAGSPERMLAALRDVDAFADRGLDIHILQLAAQIMLARLESLRSDEYPDSSDNQTTKTGDSQ